MPQTRQQLKRSIEGAEATQATKKVRSAPSITQGMISSDPFKTALNFFKAGTGWTCFIEDVEAMDREEVIQGLKRHCSNVLSVDDVWKPLIVQTVPEMTLRFVEESGIRLGSTFEEEFTAKEWVRIHTSPEIDIIKCILSSWNTCIDCGHKMSPLMNILLNRRGVPLHEHVNNIQALYTHLILNFNKVPMDSFVYFLLAASFDEIREDSFSSYESKDSATYNVFKFWAQVAYQHSGYIIQTKRLMGK